MVVSIAVSASTSPAGRPQGSDMHGAAISLRDRTAFWNGLPEALLEGVSVFPQMCLWCFAQFPPLFLRLPFFLHRFAYKQIKHHETLTMLGPWFQTF